MAEFTVKTSAVKTVADKEERLRRELDSIQQTIRGISGSSALKMAGAVSIRKRLGSLAGRVERQRGSMENMKNTLKRVANLYEETERNICGYREGDVKAEQERMKKEISSLLERLMEGIKKVVGKVSAFVGGLFAPVTTGWNKVVGAVGDIIGKLGKVFTTNKQPKVKWGDIIKLPPIMKKPELPKGGIIGGMDKENPTGNSSPSGAPKYPQPAYTQKGLDPNASTFGPYLYRRDGSPCMMHEWNDKEQKQLSCTYYTLRKLNEQGLSYPCVSGPKGNGPGNGGEWYANFDRESGLPNYAGNNALDDLANNLTLPQANVVVSFDHSLPVTDKNGKTYIPGHVLLIDEIYRDANGTVMVKYSDMSPDINSFDGDNPQKNVTLTQFKANYKPNGNINGAVVIGAGDKPRRGIRNSV